MHWCYLLVNDILGLPMPYVFAMFLFALVTTIVFFPLALRQQRSSAKMSAIQPLMQDIQKKFAKDKQRQQAELQKLNEEMGYNPLSGCLPMLIQFPLMFGLVEVIYAPLTYMLRIPGELVEALKKIVVGLGIDAKSRYIETNIIEYIKTKPELFKHLASDPAIGTIRELNLSIGSVNLWETPNFREPSWLWLMPVFSIITMLVSMFLSNRASGMSKSGNPGTGKVMMIAMSAMFGIFSFMYPAGFSLYWGMRNIISIGQSAILRKIVDPDKVKEQVMAEYNEKKKGKAKKKSTISITDAKTGEKIEKEISSGELAKLRLQRAREIDEERYSVSITVHETEHDTAEIDTEKFDETGMFDEEDKKNLKQPDAKNKNTKKKGKVKNRRDSNGEDANIPRPSIK